MSDISEILVLPYTYVVAQEQLKLALELAYISPRIGGVLISGERGTGKSTAVRAFAKMMYDTLPVTIPINATEDRVVGGWTIDELMRGKPVMQMGLLEEANDKLLYVDEINLLDDHIVNIILDVTSTGVLVIQREGINAQRPIQFTLVGTMNPEEGGLRPQLLDRFGMMVAITAERDIELRRRILRTVLAFDEAMFNWRNGRPDTFLEAASNDLQKYRMKIQQARQNLYSVEVPESIVSTCVSLSVVFQTEGHRADYLMVLAARACAALESSLVVELKHVKKVAPLVLQHRRPESMQLTHILWSEEDTMRLAEFSEHD